MDSFFKAIKWILGKNPPDSKIWQKEP